MTIYRTTKDIIIPAGTEVEEPPAYSSRWKRDYDTPIALGKDHVAYFSVDPEEGIESGWLEEVPTAGE